MPFLVVIGGFGVAAVASEVALNGMKVQTGLVRGILVYAAIGLALMAYWVSTGGAVLPLVMYWGGAFLTWFGVRSHIESSILLRMLYLLRGKHMSEEEILGEYEALYGIEMRREELVRAGLVELDADGMRVTPKGRLIVNAASWLK